jgi:hypothetical protein
MTDASLLERAKKLGIDIKDTDIWLDRLEKARGQMSNSSDEFRMQVTVIRERLAWLMREFDKLQDRIATSSPPGGSAS